MSHYCYDPLSLSPDSIRLLRLKPHKDETAPLQGELFEYSLQESGKWTHLYEALSYVWGSLENPKSISINEHNLAITVNLHGALLRLRDRSFERIIWVDSICINQKDEKEKGRQIRTMAKIYGQANRVIVYLGKAIDDGDQALEHIRAAAENESKNSSRSEKGQKAILELLEQPWFRRIWILQEVAAARCIVIIYGSAEISGEAFCSGFNQLELSYSRADMENLIRSVIYLIWGATFRPRHATSSSIGLSLGELIDMYHTHEATEANDMAYALLGMSSDDPSAAGLSVDYTVPWKILLQRLVEFILPIKVSVETWDKGKIAVVKSKGNILGYVSSVEDHNARYDKQHVNVVFNNTAKSLEYERRYGTRWTLQASAKAIQNRDSVCLLQGASKPCIIRAYKDHFAIIMIAVTLQQSVRAESRYIKRQEPLTPARSFSRDFLLVWNWEKIQRNLQSQARYEPLEAINDLIPEYLSTASNKAVRSCDVALAVGDSKEYKTAEKSLQEAIKGCERALGKEDLYTLAGIDGLASIYKSQEQWMKAEDLFSQVIQTRKRVQGMGHQDTLGSIADLASIYIDQSDSISRKDERIASLTDRIRDNVQITEKDTIQVATLFGKELASLLLDLGKDKLDITEEVLKAAARNRRKGGEVIKLLLDRCNNEVKITEEVVKAAAGNWDSGKEVMTLLLDQRGNEVKITEEVVKEAAGNSEEVMTLLLDQRGDEVKITEEVVKAAARNWDNGEEMMKLLLDQRGNEVKITEEVVKTAAGNWDSGKEVMTLLLDQRGNEVKITEEVIKAAAGNWDSGKEVMTLLLDQRGNEVKITEEVVKAAAGNWNSGKEVMTLLLDQRGNEVKITEEVVKEAAGNSEEVMTLLLDQRGDEVKITKEVVKAAAGNGRDMMTLLLDQRGDEVKITEEVVKAAVGNSEGVITLLLDQRGEEVKITEEVLKWAASNESRGYQVVQCLHQTVGIKVTVGVLEAAATSGQEQVLGLFYQWDSISSGDEERWLNISRLYNAAKNGDVASIHQLVANGIPLDKQNIRGITPLGMASKNGHTEVVEALLATGAVNVNLQSIDGHTPLFWAACYGYSKVVRLLLDHDAEPIYTDKDGISPLSAAQSNNQDAVVAMLMATNQQRRTSERRRQGTDTVNI